MGRIRAMRMTGLKVGLMTGLLLACAAQARAGEWELGVYGGWQTAPHSVVSGTDPAAGPFSFRAGWEGKSFAAPPYYGLRAIWWRDETFGFTAEFNHSKVYADAATLGAGGSSGGFETLEFTDGINQLTFGGIRKWAAGWRGFAPYAGVSAGVVIPHVEVRSRAGAPKTFNYQLAGPSVAVILGVRKPISPHFALFGEYKGGYSQIRADLEGGGHLETDLVTNALNLGLSYRF